MKIVLTGPKCTGKSTLGKEIADRLDINFYETDEIIEQLYQQEHGKKLSFYEIFQELGEKRFRQLEVSAVEKAATLDWCVLSLGGGTLLNPHSRQMLRQNSIIFLIHANAEVLWDRLVKIGRSKYLNGENAREKFIDHVQATTDAIMPHADIELNVSDGNNITEKALEKISTYLAVASKQPNTFGELIRITTFGESHGPALGVIMDGVKPGIEISEADIQKELDRRKPGQSNVSTPRAEADKIHILSGVFEGKTTGAPIAMALYNVDHDSSKYDIIREQFRPGHADFTFWKKYGIRDHKGGGRSSGRETSARVASGAIAKKILAERGVTINAYSIEIANIKANVRDLSVIEKNPVRCCDPDAAEKMQQAILDAKDKGNSVGGIVELRIKGIPAGLGDPVFAKLDARFAHAFCSLGAIKGLEFGDGFAATKMTGFEFNDNIKDGKFITNHAGGILGGISTGEEIIIKLGVRPTPSVSIPQKTSDIHGKNHDILVEGRHDPCIVPRIIPVIESMASLVLLDAWEIQKQLRDGDWEKE